MRELVNKFKEIEQKISVKKGDFVLFALFQREDSIDKWDLLVAAPWIDSDRKTALYYIAGQLQSSLNPEELVQLSRIVLIDLTNPGLNTTNDAIKIEHGISELQNINFFGLQIKRAFIITSQKPVAVGELQIKLSQCQGSAYSVVGLK
jgi:hypothetical protein